MSGSPLAVGVDIGGTKVVAGVVDTDGRVGEVVRADTPDRSKSAEVVEDVLVDLACDLVRRHDVAAVGIGAAGFVDEHRARVRFSPHLAWRDEPLRDAVERRIGVPVVIENDANAAAWAEWRFGAAVGSRSLLCITLGTGIGGSLLIGGELFRGSFGMAGEFGHMTVVPGGRACPCGNQGCWEQYASGNVLARLARAAVVAADERAEPLLRQVDGNLSRLTGRLVSRAAKAGDPFAVEVLAEVGRWLGLGIANLVAAFDPDLVIVGGGVSEAGDLLLEPARVAFAGALVGRGFRPQPRICAAALGNRAGLVGAADLARRSGRVMP